MTLSKKVLRVLGIRILVYALVPCIGSNLGLKFGRERFLTDLCKLTLYPQFDFGFWLNKVETLTKLVT